MNESPTADMIDNQNGEDVKRIKRYSKFRTKIWWVRGTSEIGTRETTPEIRALIDASIDRLAERAGLEVEA